MKIKVEKSDKDTVINLSGRLDLNSSPDLRKVALALCNSSGNLTIDLSEVYFIDTAGLATLLEILVAAKDQCVQLILFGLNEKVRYLLDVNGLTSFFGIGSSPQERLPA